MLERRVRTAKYLVFRTRENPWKQRETGGRKSLSRGGFRVVLVMTTSIPLRVCQTRSEHLEPQKRGKTKMLERRVRTAKYLVFRTRENPWKQRETGGRKSLSCGGFRVLHLRPLGQLSVSIFIRAFFQKIARKFVGEKSRRENIKVFDLEFWKPGISRSFRGDEIHRSRRNFESASLRPLRYRSVFISTSAPRKTGRTDGENKQKY